MNVWEPRFASGARVGMSQVINLKEFSFCSTDVTTVHSMVFRVILNVQRKFIITAHKLSDI